MRRRPLLLTALAGLLAACQTAFSPARDSWPPLPEGRFMHVGVFLQVSGTAVPNPQATSATQAMALSRDSALADARRRLRAYIAALPLGGGATAGARMRSSTELSRAVDKMIYSAGVASSQWDEKGNAVVLIRIDKRRINQLLGTRFR